jgi:signal peptidase II
MKKLYFLLISLLFIIDRFTKVLALTALTYDPYDLSDFITFTLAKNRGVSWSLFHTDASMGFYILTGLIIIITLALGLYTFWEYKKNKPIYSELLILTGSLSNIVDRFLYQGVIDFIDIHITSLHWPIFNIADMCIVTGIILLFIKHIRTTHV